MLVLARATISETDQNLIYLILADDKGTKYHAPFASYRKPVNTAGGVQYVKPTGKVGKFSVGQKVLIISISYPLRSELQAAKAAGKPDPLPSVEEWVRYEDYHFLFK
jgi:hypothetical protein